MSDPMTNSEVEDVLSSIRRLVSDERKTDGPAAEQTKQSVDKLVLTPSLRVSKENAKEDAQVEHDSDVPEQLEDVFEDITSEHLAAPEVPEEAQIENDAVEEFSAEKYFAEESHVDDTADANPAVPFDDGDTETDQESEVLTHESDASTHEAESKDGAPVAPWEIPQDAAVPAEQLAEESRAPASESLGDKIAALETLIAGRSDEWEPEVAGGGGNSGTEPPAMEWEDTDETETVSFTSFRSVAPEVETVPLQLDQRDADPEEDPGSVSMEDLEEVFDDASNADLDEQFDSVSAEGLQEETESASTENSEEEFDNVSADDLQDELDSVSVDDLILDEGALRELVSEMVREELQGALGERITRNVRKLVRRELHRALATQDLE